ncbi:MAG: hypothetical protein GX552_06960 [Chloroflexi bacterium]|nr:hypothetical protein [Chloroflexota bacterium]
MNAQDFWQCAEKSADWLISQQAEDGRWKPITQPVVDAYYKASWALSLMGRPTAAHRSLDYAARHLLQPNGDVQPRQNRWHSEVHYPYANAYFVMGGVRLARYDVAWPAMCFLRTLQSPASGAFASVYTEDNIPVRCDTMSTAGAGLACLAAGCLDAACRAADWLQALVERQPTPDRAFFCTVDAENNLVTQFPESDSPWRVVRTDQPNQIWYAVGLPFAFLIKLAQATARMEYLHLALWFFDFQQRCVNPWAGPSSGKAGWGCAELYRMTGEARYRDIALSIGEYMAGFQAPDGSFQIPLSAPYDPQRPLTPGDFDLTAEYTVWLGEIAANLLVR